MNEEEVLKTIKSHFPNNKHEGLGKHGLYLYQEMDLRETIKLTLQERNAEVKQAIENELNWINNEIVRLDETYKNRPSISRDKTKLKYRKAVKHLLKVKQKLGLDAKEGGGVKNG